MLEFINFIDFELTLTLYSRGPLVQGKSEWREIFDKSPLLGRDVCKVKVGGE